MTRALLITVGVLLLFAPLAIAQERVQVLSGEHDGFSRLVFQVRPDLPYGFSTQPGLIRLSFPGRQLAFDLSGLFEKLSHKRLVSVRPLTVEGGSALELSLGCACEPYAFPFRNSYLVVDIRDPAEIVPAPVAAELDRPVAAGRRAARSIYEPAGNPPVLAGVRPPATPVPKRAPLTGPPIDTAAAADPDAETGHLVRHAHEALLDQLARAEKQGLIGRRVETLPVGIESNRHAPSTGAVPISPDGKAGGAEPKRRRPPKVVDAGPDPENHGAVKVFADPPRPRPIAAGQTASARRGQVSVTTVFDRDDPPDGQQLDPAHLCPDDRDLMIWQWADSRPAHDQLAAARADLLGEFDRPEPSALRHLMRIYVAFGFGREALALMTSFEMDMVNTPLLADLARAVDGQPAMRHGPLDLAKSCPGLAAVMRGASFGFDAPLAPDARKSLFAAFAEMPAPQRRQFGPRLSAALLAVGDRAAAIKISEIAARAPGTGTPEQALIAARLDLADGPDADPMVRLRKLALKGGAEAPGAFALLVNTLVSEGRPVPTAILAALALAQFENRGTSDGSMLLKARIRALIAADSAAKAYDVLDDALRDENTGPDEMEMLSAVLVAYRPDMKSPADYVQRVWHVLPRLDASAQADAARTVIAGHLTGFGLPNLSLQVLAPALARGAPDARVEAAKAFLAEERSQPAIDIVSGLSGKDAESLTARALAAGGDPESAFRLLAGADAPGTAEGIEYAWQAGAWKSAAHALDEARRFLAGYMFSRPGPEVDRRRRAGGVAEPGAGVPLTLNAARKTVERSAATRDLVLRAIAAETPATR